MYDINSIYVYTVFYLLGDKHVILSLLIIRTELCHHVSVQICCDAQEEQSAVMEDDGCDFFSCPGPCVMCEGGGKEREEAGA